MSLNGPRHETATRTDCLVRQAAEAKLALADTLIDVRHDLARAIAPRRQLKWKTWTTLGAAAIAGYAVGAVSSLVHRHRNRNAAIAEAVLAADPIAPTRRPGLAAIFAGWVIAAIKFEVGRAIGRMIRASLDKLERIE